MSSALYVIESRAAYLALKARNATAPVLSAGVLEEQERAFLSALAAGRDLPPPTIQELDQFAPQWAYLVPPDAVARAELAHRFGDKYRFRESDVGRMRAALGLDDPAVQQAYRDRHRGELDDVYDTDLTGLEKLRWSRSRLFRRLEELPPFWTTYGLTLTETIGAGMLALPIAVAGVGPLPGVAIIVVLGLLNVLTVAAVAETFTRTGSVRWRGAYFGRVVRGYLGRTGGVAFGVGMTIYTAPVLLACYVGFAVTVAKTTGTSAPLWAAGLFAANIALIFRKRLDATIASALIVGFFNVLGILILVVLALTVLDVDNMRYTAVPFLDGRPFDPSVLELAFGVVLLCFYGHTSVGNCAKVVLTRDPGGRSLMTGSVAAMLTVVALYSLWVFSVGSAVPAARLQSELGTALVPLAEEAGRAASIVGFVFVFLAVGMGTVHLSLGLYNLVAERLVTRRRTAMAPGAGPDRRHLAARRAAHHHRERVVRRVDGDRRRPHRTVDGRRLPDPHDGVEPAPRRLRAGAVLAVDGPTGRRRARLPRLHGDRGDLRLALADCRPATPRGDRRRHRPGHHRRDAPVRGDAAASGDRGAPRRGLRPGPRPGRGARQHGPHGAAATG